MLKTVHNFFSFPPLPFKILMLLGIKLIEKRYVAFAQSSRCPLLDEVKGKVHSSFCNMCNWTVIVMSTHSER